MGYEVLIGFLHVLRLVRAEGVDVTEFAERVAGSLAGYPPLLMDRRIADGHGDQGFSSLFELLGK